jgi:hypothetical protein
LPVTDIKIVSAGSPEHSEKKRFFASVELKAQLEMASSVDHE